MNTGMLWFDNDKNTNTLTKIERAVEYYRKKYKQDPDLCYLNPQMLNALSQAPPKKSNGRGERLIMGDVEIHKTPLVLPNHFWIGVNDVAGKPSRAV